MELNHLIITVIMLIQLLLIPGLLIIWQALGVL